jgi:hypothetical protein
VKPYLFPHVCFTCRLSFKRSRAGADEGRTCPQCGGPVARLARKFKAPPMDDLAQWEKVRLLVDNGFLFGTVYDEQGQSVAYPETLREARAFVARYHPRAPVGVPLKRRR